MTLQDEQAEIDIEIVEEAIASTPESWDDFFIYLEYIWPDDPDKLGSVSISLRNKANNDLATPNDELYAAIQKLNKLFYRYGVAWMTANYRIFKSNEEKWKFEANFQY